MPPIHAASVRATRLGSESAGVMTCEGQGRQAVEVIRLLLCLASSAVRVPRPQTPEAQTGRYLGDLLPLGDYVQTRHGLILPAERASACVQDSA